MNNLKCECLTWARVFDPTDNCELAMHHPNCDKRRRVYEVNDCEWVVSTSPEEARRWYLEDYLGYEDDGSEEFCHIEPRELSESEMNKLTYFDPDNVLEGEKKKYSFKEALANMVSSETYMNETSMYFATTEI